MSAAAILFNYDLKNDQKHHYEDLSTFLQVSTTETKFSWFVCQLILEIFS